MTGTIDQPGTLGSGLLVVSAAENIIIQHDTASTAAVVVTMSGTATVELLDTFTVQNYATFINDSGIAVNGLDQVIIGANGTYEQGAAVGVNLLNGITFSGTAAELVIDNGFSVSTSSVLQGFTHGDAIDFKGVGSATSVTETYISGLSLFSGDTEFNVTLANSSVEEFYATGNVTANSFSLAGDSAGGFTLADAPCFAQGTKILTAAGEIAVEELSVGDTAILHDGGTAKIIFIGHRKVDLCDHPRPETVRPVRILAGSIAPGTPARELLLSPDHALYFDGMLVPAKNLVDGVSIKQDKMMRSVGYFHVELQAHGILIANGAPAESFLNVGHRGLFDNADEPVMLETAAMHVARAAQSCAPLVTGGPALAAIRARLHARLCAYGFSVTKKSRLRLSFSNGAYAAAELMDDRAVFAIPPGARHAVLSSEVFAPAETDPASDDRRRLGIALAGVRIDGAAPARSPLNPDDMHPCDAGDAVAWTRGDLRIALPPGARSIAFEIAGWPRLWDDGCRAA